MPWIEIFAVFVMSHLFGDFLLQTDEQALNKYGGLRRGRRERRALVSHVACYGLSYLPALIWLAGEHSALAVAAIAIGVALPHLLIDDGTPVTGWLRVVKKAGDVEPGTPLFVYVDQSMHLLCLFALALLTGT